MIANQNLSQSKGLHAAAAATAVAAAVVDAAAARMLGL